MQFPHPPRTHGHSIWYYLFEGAYGFFQWITAKAQAERIARNLPISHFWWGVAAGAAAIILILAYKRLTRCSWKKALKLGFALLLVRFVTFSPWLNRMRGKPFFYVGKGSLQDRILSGSFQVAWIIAAALLLIMQIV